MLSATVSRVGLRAPISVNQPIAILALKLETKSAGLRLVGANESFDVTTRTEPPFPRPASTRPEHQATGRHYPGEWARQYELYLDKEPRRIVLYAALFGAFVVGVVISAVVRFGS